ncbi:MAG: DsbE family thiol:disulfide interchange protein [Gammaproteobacteria bacterium]|nr:DsbE family thiol:disulfide interchange protein [Gammaproteobacteria bacterium]
MKKLIPLITFIAISIFLYLSLNSNPRELPSPLIDKAFPDIEVEDFYTGEVTSIRDTFSNNTTLVNVWASWCTTCRAEHKMLMNIARDVPIQLIGLNYKDTREDANKTLEFMGNPFDLIVFDPKGKAGLELGVYATPETFLVNQQGVIVHKHIGEITQAVWTQEFLPRIAKKNIQ